MTTIGPKAWSSRVQGKVGIQLIDRGYVARYGALKPIELAGLVQACGLAQNSLTIPRD